MPEPTSSLHAYSDFDALWEELLRPWLLDRQADALAASEPVVLTCASTALVAAVKARLLDEPLSGLGIHFNTPGGLRRLLLQNYGLTVKIALREDLHLLARMTAEEQPEDPLWQAVARSPKAFIRAFDALDEAGWKPEAFSEPAARRLASALSLRLKEVGLMTVRSVDRSLLTAAAGTTPRLSYWFSLGFTSANWGDWPLLQAALMTARQAILAHREEGDAPAARYWVNSWEAQLGPSDYLPARQLPYRTLSDHFAGHSLAEEKRVDFSLSATLHEEANGIIAQIQKAFHDKPAGRIGLVLPRQVTALGRELSLRLAEGNIPHHDLAGYRPAQTSAQQLFTLWANYQMQPSLSNWLDFTRSLADAGLILEKVASRNRHMLEEAFHDVQSEQMDVLLAYVSHQGSQTLSLSWPVLPAEAPFSRFMEACEAPLKALRWPQDWPLLAERGRAFGGLKLPRKTFLGWLQEVADIPGRSRAPCGREPFAPVQLITLDDAYGQSWDTLILAGMQQGEWPPEEPESPFLSSAQMQRLNQQALQPGPYSADDPIICPGHTILAEAAAGRQRREAFFNGLLAAPRQQLIATASLADPQEPTLKTPLSEWFLRLYAADRGAWLSPQAMLQPPLPTPSAAVAFPEIRLAALQRHDSETPFGAHSFCFTAPPDEPLTLSASAWERALEYPAQVWYENILKIRRRLNPGIEDTTAMTRGNWIHAWLNPGDTFQPKPDAQAWCLQVRQRADGLQKEVTSAYAKAGSAVPAVWISLWESARHLALVLAERVAEAETPPLALGEWNLGQIAITLLPEEPPLSLRGRIDLLLAEHDAEPSQAGRLQLIDFKTGADEALSLSRLQKGKGIQLALYTAALMSLGASEVSATLLSHETPSRPQIDQTRLAELENIWSTFIRIQETGQLGDLGDGSGGFGYAPPRPIADLLPPRTLLTEKWQLTHPDLQKES